MVRAYDRGSPSKDRAPKGRAYRSSTGLVSQPVILAFCATILLLLSVAGYNTHLLLKHSRHKDRASVTVLALAPRSTMIFSARCQGLAAFPVLYC